MPTMNLQEISHQWFKVLSVWGGSFGTKYDPPIPLFLEITTDSTKICTDNFTGTISVQIKLWVKHTVQFFSTTSFCIYTFSKDFPKFHLPRRPQHVCKRGGIGDCVFLRGGLRRLVCVVGQHWRAFQNIF